METVAPERSRLPSLTGLRYVAAAAVVVHHVAPAVAAGTWFERLSATGYAGVTFFFVLSGFVLTWSAQGTRDVPPARFYRRRFARVYPLHAVTWAAAIVASYAAGDHKTGLSMLLSLLLLQAWGPATEIHYGGNTPSWSLSCEAFFYALFPFLAFRGPRLADRARWLPVAVVLVTAGGLLFSVTPAYSDWFAYVSPIYRVGEFLVGILLAAAVRGGLRVRMPLGLAVGVLGAVYLVSTTVFAGQPKGFVDALVLPAVVLTLAAAASADLQGRRSVWAAPLVVRLGEWSFALYLIHYSAAKLLDRLLGGHDVGAVAGPALGVAFLAVMTAVAGLAYSWIERPMERRFKGGSRTPAVEPGGAQQAAAVSGGPATRES